MGVDMQYDALDYWLPVGERRHPTQQKPFGYAGKATDYVLETSCILVHGFLVVWWSRDHGSLFHS